MGVVEVEAMVGRGAESSSETKDQSFSIVLFSGTDDRLTAAAVLVAGAAAMGRRVNILLQYWALDAFCKDRIGQDHGMAPEATGRGADALWRARVTGTYQHWSETLRQAKEIGEVSIHACALTMDVFGVAKEDLDPLVDGIEGVAAFMLGATGPVVFI